MKNTMPVGISLTVCCLMLMTGSASNVFAASRITSDVKITPQAPLTPAERRSLSIAVSRMFHHVDRARKEIARKDAKAALKNVEQAFTLVKIIDNAVPELQVSATIKSGDLTYRDADRVKEVLVPIYKEEDEFIDASSSGGKSGKRTVVKRSVGRTIYGAGLEEREILFDVREAKSFLEDAIADLKKDNLQHANLALAGIRDAVVLLHEKVDLPLERARMNLLEASRLAAANQFDAAEAFLQRTVRALENYQGEVGEGTGRKVSALIDSINALSGKLEQDKAGAQKKLSGFLSELSGWL